jgi:hypothetical protein
VKSTSDLQSQVRIQKNPCLINDSSHALRMGILEVIENVVVSLFTPLVFLLAIVVKTANLVPLLWRWNHEERPKGRRTVVSENANGHGE